MGKKKRDEFLRSSGISEIDFLPERPYSINGFKAFPRKGTDDFYMFYIPREEKLGLHLIMQKGETFVDVGVNIGYYSLRVAKEYSAKGVMVIAIEAHPDNYSKNIELNDFKCVLPINKAVSDHKGIVRLYERVDWRNRIRSEYYSLSNAFLNESNFARPEAGALEVECDTLDNILGEQRVDVKKIDIE